MTSSGRWIVYISPSIFCVPHSLTSAYKWEQDVKWAGGTVSAAQRSVVNTYCTFWHKGFQIISLHPYLKVIFTYRQLKLDLEVCWGPEQAEANIWHSQTHTNTYTTSTLGICRLLSCCCHLRMVSCRRNQILMLPTRTHLPTWIAILCSCELRSCSRSLTRRGL